MNWELVLNLELGARNGEPKLGTGTGRAIGSCIWEVGTGNRNWELELQQELGTGIWNWNWGLKLGSDATTSEMCRNWELEQGTDNWN